MSERPSVYARYSRGSETAKQAAKRVGTSERTARRWTSQPREEWIAQKAIEREQVRAYHDDECHSWPQTAKHFGVSVEAVKQRAYRARKDRDAKRQAEQEAAEQAERDRISPPLPLDL